LKQFPTSYPAYWSLTLSLLSVLMPMLLLLLLLPLLMGLLLMVMMLLWTCIDIFDRKERFQLGQFQQKNTWFMFNVKLVSCRIIGIDDIFG